MPDLSRGLEEPDPNGQGELPPVSERLTASFSPAPVTMAPDGGLQVADGMVPTVFHDDEWICQRGPCRHFHVMTTNFEAVKPMDGSLEYADGSPVSAPRQTIYTCYPSVGIETDLGDAQVFECNLWDPIDPLDDDGRARRRLAYEARTAELEVDTRRPGGIVAWLRRRFGR